MEMYKAYIKEVYGQETIETNYGFITYKIVDNYCHVETFYIQPGYRKTGLAWKIWNLLLKETKDIKGYTCELDINNRYITENICVFSKAGFKVMDNKNNHILMYRGAKDA